MTVSPIIPPADAPARPITLLVVASGVPEVMRAERRWVGWRWELVRDRKTGTMRWTKVPYQARAPKHRASSTNPKTWGTFEQAMAALAHGDVHGVGFVLGDGWVGVDLDHCRDAHTGEIEPWAERIVAAMASHTEASPTDTGLHIILHATMPGDGSGQRRGPLEVYGAGRYFTMTGRHFDGTPETVEERQAQLDALLAEHFASQPAAQSPRRQVSPAAVTTIADADLLALALDRDGKFAALWAGDTSAYANDESCADAAMCMKLAFWTGRNAASMDALFRQSGLMRDKWDEKRGDSTWGAREIAAAISLQTETYTPKQARETARPAPVAHYTVGAKPSAGHPYMPNISIDAHSIDRASMGIYDGEGHLWRGFIEVATVKPEAVKWLWQGRIPLGKITIVDGDPDLGKSVLFGADIPARITTGEAMPDDTPGLGEPAGVVLVSAEDEVPDTIRPRLDAAGADVSRVLALYSVPRYKTLDDGSRVAEEGSFTIPRDLDWLRAAITHKNAKYVLIDPLMSYLQPSETNSYRDQDVRTALAPLARLAADTSVAIVAIRHLNKGTSANPLYRGGGSIGIIAAARSAMLVAADPDDPDKQRRILARIKGNLAAPVPALAYHLAVTADGVPYIAWEGATEHTAAQLLAMPVDEETRSETDEAVEWLRGELADGEEHPAKDVEDAAKNAAIKPKALRRARERLHVTSARKGFGPGSYVVWTLPPEPQNPVIVAQPPIVAIDAHVPEVGIYADAEQHTNGNGHAPMLTSKLAERVAQLNAQGIHGDAAVKRALAERGALPTGGGAA